MDPIFDHRHAIRRLGVEEIASKAAARAETYSLHRKKASPEAAEGIKDSVPEQPHHAQNINIDSNLFPNQTNTAYDAVTATGIKLNI